MCLRFGKYSDLIRKKGNKYTTQDKEDILRIAERNKADLSNIGEQKNRRDQIDPP
mgnify:CR=1 FL=1